MAACEARVGGERLFAQRLRRNGAMLDALPGEMLQAGDVVAVAGKRDALVSLLGTAHAEVEDPVLLDIPVASFDVLVTSTELSGRTLAEFAALDWTRNLYTRSMMRGTEAIPVGPGTQVPRGDVIRILGPEATVTAAMAAVQARAHSPVAVLGYTPTVPLGHILLTTWGTLIVRFVAG